MPVGRELVDGGLVRIEHRRAGRRNLTNRYHLTTIDPTVTSPAVAADLPPPPTPPRRPARTTGTVRAGGCAGSRESAATRGLSGGCGSAGRAAAGPQPNPEKTTKQPPPPNPTTRPESSQSSRWQEDRSPPRIVAVGRSRHLRTRSACVLQAGVADAGGLRAGVEQERELAALFKAELKGDGSQAGDLSIAGRPSDAHFAVLLA